MLLATQPASACTLPEVAHGAALPVQHSVTFASQLESASDEVLEWSAADEIEVTAVQVPSFDGDSTILDTRVRIVVTGTIDDVRDAISLTTGYFPSLLDVRVAVRTCDGTVVVPVAGDTHVATLFPGLVLHDDDIMLVFTATIPSGCNAPTSCSGCGARSSSSSSSTSPPR